MTMHDRSTLTRDNARSLKKATSTAALLRLVERSERRMRWLEAAGGALPGARGAQP
jgi:hypothetical protein